jgi:hypothetical protein
LYAYLLNANLSKADLSDTQLSSGNLESAVHAGTGKVRRSAPSNAWDAKSFLLVVVYFVVLIAVVFLFIWGFIGSYEAKRNAPVDADAEREAFEAEYRYSR